MPLSLPLPQDAIVTLAKDSLDDRIIGCLFGSALGDAIGLYTEFLSGEVSARAYPSRSFTLHPRFQATPFRQDSHRDPNVPGDWTDDTDHAMLLLLSYLHSDGKKLDPRDFASRLHTWVRMGLRVLDTLPLGLGNTVGSIVRSKGYLEDPEKAARAHWRRRNFNVAPNGSLMRTHPLGLFCVGRTLEETFQIAADFSVVTHVDPRCIVSCAIGTALVRGLVRGEVAAEKDIDGMVALAISWYEAYDDRQRRQDPSTRDEPKLDLFELQRHVRVICLADLELDDAIKLGYVYKTLGSGLHLLRLAMRRTARAETEPKGVVPTASALFEDLIVDLIMMGGDADTNACFAGALLGAYLGYKALPPHWRDGLNHGSWLMKKAEGLSYLLGIGRWKYSGSADVDTALDGGRGFLTEKQMEERYMLLQAQMAQRTQDRARREEEGQKKRARDQGHWFRSK